MTNVQYIENHCSNEAEDCVLIINDRYYGIEVTDDLFMIKERVDNKDKAHVFKGTREPLHIISICTGSNSETNFKIVPAASLGLKSRKRGKELKKGESPLTIKQKLDEIHYILHTHTGDKASLKQQINKIVDWQND